MATLKIDKNSIYLYNGKEVDILYWNLNEVHYRYFNEDGNSEFNNISLFSFMIKAKYLRKNTNRYTAYEKNGAY